MMQGNQHTDCVNQPGRLSPSPMEHGARHRNVTSYQDLKNAFLNTDDSMGGMAAHQVFQRVEEVVEEMVQRVLLGGSEERRAPSVDQDAAMMLLLLRG
jgi:hypothetical protein